MNSRDLKRYKYNQIWIKERMEHVEEYKTYITKVTTVLSDTPNGSKKVQDSIAEKLVTLMDSVDELTDKMIEEDKKQREILKQLDKVEQPYRVILEKNYIQGKTLVTVASEMGYSYDYAKKMNGVALKKFEEVTKCY